MQAACPVAMFPRRGAQSTTVEHFLDLVLAQEAAPTRFFLFAFAHSMAAAWARAATEVVLSFFWLSLRTIRTIASAVEVE